MILLGKLTGPETVEDSVDARDSESVLHDLKNMLTAIAAMTARSQATLGPGDSSGHDEARKTLADLEKKVAEAMQIMRHKSCEAIGGGVDIDDHIAEHEVALGRLLGDTSHFEVRNRMTETRTIVDIDETDLLRVLVSMVRQAESQCTGGGGLRLDVETSSTFGPTPTRSGLLPPRRYAQLRVSCTNCGSHGASLGGPHEHRVQRTPLTLRWSMNAVETILEEANGGLRIVHQPAACPAVEVLLPARA